MGFSRQEYWSGLPFPSSGDPLVPGIKPGSPALRADSFTTEPPGKPCVIEDNSNLWPESKQALLIGRERGSTLVISMCAKSRQLCPTLCNPMDCSLPGSSVHGVLQARILECVAISFSRGSSSPRDQTGVS